MAEILIRGIGVSEGIRIGTAYVYERPKASEVPESINEHEAEAAAVRFKAAVKQAGEEVDRLIERTAGTLGTDKIGVLKGQKSILADPAYCPEIEKLITKKLCSPEKAVKQVTEKFAGIFENMKNAYMRERAADVRDAGERLLGILSGRQANVLSVIDRPVILAAEDLSPSDTIQLDKNFILAFVTQKGGKTSHTSIFAKTLGIPAAVGLGEQLRELKSGDTVIVDGAQGLCIINPDSETKTSYTEKMKREQERALLLKSQAQRMAATADGVRIVAAANIGSAADAEYALAQGAEGAGLLRTEQIYLSKKALPDEEEQFTEYKRIAEAFGERGVIVRTLDIGGDKALAYLNIPKEDNPFLGYRAIRLCLDRRDLFLTQLRAILRASACGKLSIMFPMISGVDELRAAKSVLDEAKSQLTAEGIPFDADIKAGIMVEVPSTAVMADLFAQETDFFSIGTNDLVQYTLAVDRGNEKVSALYDYCNPAVIRLISNVALAAHNAGIPVGMCGGMAGETLAIPLLIGLGLDELSMPAGVIAEAKYTICRHNKSDCENLARDALLGRSAAEIRALLKGFAENTP